MGSIFPRTKLSLLGQPGLEFRPKWFTWWVITDDWSTLWHYAENILNSDHAVWYVFGIAHFVSLSAFFPGPTGSADKAYQKNKSPQKNKAHLEFGEVLI